MLSELPVIIHNGPIFRWLTNGTAATLIDMSVPGQLTSALSEEIQGANTSNKEDALAQARQMATVRFSWGALVPEYLNMYRAVLEN